VLRCSVNERKGQSRKAHQSGDLKHSQVRRVVSGENMMRRKKPELVDVQVIQWDVLGGLYGVMTTYDDGVVEREPWSDLAHTRLTVALRRMEIRQERLPRRSIS
jgi:hypothetical protein